jgi:hypothetical protein
MFNFLFWGNMVNDWHPRTICPVDSSEMTQKIWVTVFISNSNKHSVNKYTEKTYLMNWFIYINYKWTKSSFQLICQGQLTRRQLTCSLYILQNRFNQLWCFLYE